MINTHRASERTCSLATTLVVLATCSVFASCDQPLATGVLADAQPAKARTTSSLEFDLPPEYWTKNADGSFVIIGFRLGYFRPGESEPITTRDIMRDAVVVEGSAARLPLPSQVFPEGVTDVVLRVQTLTGAGSSEWSAPSEATTSVVRVRAAAKSPSRKRPQLSMSDVEVHPRLAEALRTAVPPAVKLDAVLTAFPTIDELALGVVLDRDRNVPLEKLSSVMNGPPRRSLRNALREINPAVNNRPELRKLREVARRLLERPPAKGK